MKGHAHCHDPCKVRSLGHCGHGHDLGHYQGHFLAHCTWSTVIVPVTVILSET